LLDNASRAPATRGLGRRIRRNYWRGRPQPGRATPQQTLTAWTSATHQTPLRGEPPRQRRRRPRGAAGPRDRERGRHREPSACADDDVEPHPTHGL